jgi:two-component system, response regulator PdtaR
MKNTPSDRSEARRQFGSFCPDRAVVTGAHDLSSSTAGNKGMTHSLRVLVVEDDALIAVLLAKVLEEMGHDVCAIAATETLAVTEAVRCRPDLMIVDVYLGHGSGVSAVERILRSGFIPHVFVTGDASMLDSGGPDVVTILKPFREEDLLQAIRRALDHEASLLDRQTGRAGLSKTPDRTSGE